MFSKLSLRKRRQHTAGLLDVADYEITLLTVADPYSLSMGARMERLKRSQDFVFI